MSLLRDDNDDLDMLQAVQDGRWPTRGQPSSSSGTAESRPAAERASVLLSALADEHCLEGIAVADVAATVVKMLAVCVTCGSRPTAAAVAFDRGMQWFDISLDSCWECFTEFAVSLYRADASRSADNSNQTDALRVTASSSDTDPRIDRLLRRGTLRGLPIASGGRALQKSSSVQALAYSPDGATIVTGSANGVLRQLDVASGECQRELYGHHSAVLFLAYSPDGATIASGGYDRTVRLWDAASGECLCVRAGHYDIIYAVAFSPAGTAIAIARKDLEVRVCDVSSGKCLRVLQGHSNGIMAVAYSPDGKTVVTGSQDMTVRLWDAASGECQRVLQGHTDWVLTVTCSPDGATIATSGRDGSVRLWDLASGTCNRVLQAGGGDQALSYSPDGAMIAISSRDRVVRVRDVASGDCRYVFVGQTFRVVSAVRFSPDGATIATGSGDGTVRLWDANPMCNPSWVPVGTS